MSYKKSIINAGKLSQCIGEMLLLHPFLMLLHPTKNPLYPLIGPWKDLNIWERGIRCFMAIPRGLLFAIGLLFGALFGTFFNIPNHSSNLRPDWNHSKIWWCYPAGLMLSIIGAGMSPTLAIPLWSALLPLALFHVIAIIANSFYLIPSVYRYWKYNPQYEAAQKHLKSLPNAFEYKPSIGEYVADVIAALKKHYWGVRLNGKRNYRETAKHYTQTENFKTKLSYFLAGSQTRFNLKDEEIASIALDDRNDPKKVLILFHKLAAIQSGAQQTKEEHEALKAYLKGDLSFLLGKAKQKS